MTSHEAICVLNCGDQDAHLELTIYFENREPVGPYKFTVGAKRTRHLRINNLTDPAPIPKETPYAWTLSSNVPVVVQQTRLDSRQSANALMTTVPFS